MLLVANAADVRCRYREPDLDAATGRGDGTREEHAVGPAVERSAGRRSACGGSGDSCGRAAELGETGGMEGWGGPGRQRESKDGAARDGRPYRAPREMGLHKERPPVQGSPRNGTAQRTAARTRLPE